MPLNKLAKIIEESSRDSARARNSVSDPRFLEGVKKDRRKALSSFETVQHALADRKELTNAKAAKAKAGTPKPGAPKAGAKRA